MSKAAVSTLYETMTKRGISPNYELIKSDHGTHINKFVMRLKCSVVPNGEVFTVDGVGLSKKEAKRQAALVFMRKFNLLSEDINNQPSSQAPIYRSANSSVVNVAEDNKHTLLQRLCTKHCLGMPEYKDLHCSGPSHSRNFTVQCRVSDLSTKGQGSTKREARSNAATKMIQVLMEEQEVYEIFQSPSFAASVNSNEIFCETDNLKGSEILEPARILAQKRSSAGSLDLSMRSKTSCVQLSATCKNSVPVPVGIRVVNDKTKAANGSKNCVDSNTKISLTDFEDNSKKVSASTRDRSQRLNNLSEIVQKGAEEKSRKIVRAQAVSKIESTLEKVEKLLYNEILDNLESKYSLIQKTVVILHHEYVIHIDTRSCIPIIKDGESDCADASIRIACLSKLLINLNDHVKKYGAK